MLHVEAPQEVPLLTLQVPSPAQVAALQLATLAVQAVCGSEPPGTGVQVPRVPRTLQAMQPAQEAAATPQHTPSTQLPEVQLVATVQGVPRPPFGVHWLLMQRQPFAPQLPVPAQSAVILQPGLQVVPAQ